MRCFKAPPPSERSFQVFFSINYEEPWCVEGIDFQTYIAITSNTNRALDFLWDRITDGGIEYPSGGIKSMQMGENGLDFKPIDEPSDDVDDSRNKNDNSSKNETDKEKLSGNDVLINNDIHVPELNISNSENQPGMTSAKPSSIKFNPGKIVKNTRKKKSTVWSFFIKTPKGGECKLCTKKVAAPGNTTNLKNHLKRSHYDSYTSVFVDLNVNNCSEGPVQVNNNKKDLKIQSIIMKSEQPRIDTSFNRMSSYKSGGTQHERITNALVFMIVKDDLPYMAIEKQGLKMLLMITCPHYHIPSRYKITELIEEKAEVLTMLLKKKLEAFDSFSMTADIWTETMTSRSFLGCTIHYVEENSLKTFTLNMVEMTDRNEAVKISEQFEIMLTKWNIPKEKITAVVTDNGKNMVKAVKDTFGQQKGLRCFAHSLNLTMTETFDKSKEMKEIIDKVHEIVVFFKKQNAAIELKKVQNSDEVLKLIQDVPTRWNSKFYMLERFLRILDSIVTALVNCDKANLLLSSSDVSILREVVELLRPIENVTKRVSGQNYVTSGELLYHLHYLLTTLSSSPTTTEMAKKVKQTLLQSVRSRFASIETHSLVGPAALLDPRLKKKFFPPGTSYSTMRKKINDLLSGTETPKRTNLVKSTINKNSIDNDLLKYHSELVKQDQESHEHSTVEEGDIDLKKYLDQAIIGIENDPIDYWYQKKNEAPRLSKLAMKYLSIPATSVPSERLFSSAGQIVSAIRNRISAAHLQQLLFLKSINIEEWKLQ